MMAPDESHPLPLGSFTVAATDSMLRSWMISMLGEWTGNGGGMRGGLRFVRLA